MAPKTDNSKLASKLALRRHFLEKYHSDRPPAVIDACCGDGVIWRSLLEEGFVLGGYWGLDLKAKSGRLAMDSVRMLTQPGWQADILDLDTYGSLWKHYNAMLPNLSGPLTVFLTIGQYQMGIDANISKAMGLNGLRPPPAILRKICRFSLSYCLTRCYDYDIVIIEAQEAPPSTTARYVGIRLEQDAERS